MSLEIGSTIGVYRLTQLIGQGGMGLVYVAEHTLIGKRAALKVVRPELVAQEGVATRFINEARAVNTIGDEHIVDIFDAGQTPEGVVYCVMELLTGESLQDFHRRRGKLDLDTVFDITLQIARALQACHQKHIVHRDLKPANVFIVRRGGAPFVKILDFGVAKLIGQSSGATHSNAIIGTPYYMPPEQCRGSKDLDHRIDVYALGVMLYELCTGSLPFEGNSVADVIIKQATEPPIDPRVREPALPEWLSRVILKAMEKERDARFTDMAAFAAAIEEHLPAKNAPGRHSAPPGDVRASGTSVAPAKATAGPAATLEPAVAPASSPTKEPPRDVAAPPVRKVNRPIVAGAALLAVVGLIVASRLAVTPPGAAASADPPARSAPGAPNFAGERPPGAASDTAPALPANAPAEPAMVTPAAEAVPVPLVRPVPAPPPSAAPRPTAAPPPIAPPAPSHRGSEAKKAPPGSASAPAITVTPVAASARPAPPPPKPRANLETFFPP